MSFDRLYQQILTEVNEVFPGLAVTSSNAGYDLRTGDMYLWITNDFSTPSFAVEVKSKGSTLEMFVMKQDVHWSLFRDWLWKVFDRVQASITKSLEVLGLDPLLVNFQSTPDGRKYIQGRPPITRMEDMFDMDWGDGGAAVLAGGIKSGKSTLALRIARDFRQHGNVHIVNDELSPAKLRERYKAMFPKEGVCLFDITAHNLTVKDTAPLSCASFKKWLQELPDKPALVIVDDNQWSGHMVNDVIKRMSMETGRRILQILQARQGAKTPDEIFQSLSGATQRSMDAVFAVEQVGGVVTVLKHRSGELLRIMPQIRR